MAGADYYSCDVCGAKTFYDADLSYGDFQYNENPLNRHPWPDGDVGFMVVLCKKCSLTHKVVIIER